MKTMKIYEPAMCCSTGLCGVGVDTELLRISTVLNTLENNGVHVDRFNLSNNPQKFVTNQTINNYVKENGVDGLPVVVIDDEITITGRYPTNDEFVKLLNVPENYIGEKPDAVNAASKKTQGCGCSGGDCCC
ncbi:arsenite efflux transporter metallochaperone ArsD [Clostridium boliviensis]|uniref:Arsenite efflux transporter metallochaperone ArsD n=1 Tax=Clostridium boliviensis TaxID=318465 RepID=A0ABU4GR92_9CLOT|nr:arsenite efflux transporter metallochaperone ArsD [Clostridium boliviensis]MDW2800165.1 arsenite efflux transporter metallochaperone ArsD [Clostridium boliviensis]